MPCVSIPTLSLALTHQGEGRGRQRGATHCVANAREWDYFYKLNCATQLCEHKNAAGHFYIFLELARSNVVFSNIPTAGTITINQIK